MIPKPAGCRCHDVRTALELEPRLLRGLEPCPVHPIEGTIASKWGSLFTLLKDNYNGRYRGCGPCHLQMHKELMMIVKKEFPSNTPYSIYYDAPMVMQMMGMPIVTNNSLAIGAWQLVRNLTREVVESGVVHVDGTDGTQTE